MSTYIYESQLNNLSRRPLGQSRLRYHKMERNLRRIKNQKYPKRPKNASEIKKLYEDPEVIQNFGYNMRKTSRFYIDTVMEPESVFTVYASQQVIDMIKTHIPVGQRTYLMDGTFSVVPVSSYYQLLIIYIQYKNDVSLPYVHYYINHIYYTIRIIKMVRVPKVIHDDFNTI